MNQVQLSVRESIKEVVIDALYAGDYVAPKLLASFIDEIDLNDILLARKYGFRGRVGGGAAAAWSFTNGGRTKLLDGTFDIDSDTWKIALFLSTSNLAASSTTYAGLTNEVASANGYTTGGISIVLTLAGTTTVTVSYSTSIVWTASGGSITARFAVIYEVSGNVLCYTTLDSSPADVTATTGNTLTITANASGVFTLA